MRLFDFSGEVERAVWQANDEASILSARTEVGRKLFPGAAAQAGFSLLRVGEPFLVSPDEQVLVIGVATWSDPDLATLDRVAERTLDKAARVVVFDIDDWTLDEIVRVFPGVQQFKSTPLVLQYREGALTFCGDGRDGIRWLDQI